MRGFKSILASVLLVGALVSAAAFADASIAKNSTPEQVVSTVFDAYKKNDINTLVDNVVNKLGINNVEFKNQLEIEQKNDPVTGYAVKSLEKVSETTYRLKVDINHRDAGISPDELTVGKQQNNTWKVIIEPRTINAIKGSPDYGQVKKDDSENLKKIYDSRAGVTPFATSVLYYSFNFGAGKSDTSGTF
ncbi:hypothetical protein SK3146_04730 [Paenibacillus konkukensis]|uniref:Cell wall-binding protein n=2 Tax=Paenibacillus TaxID=44249 RepID=A0ABY4RSA6_9BACL|nr:hypothetical protein SK3146_04730 [Paenibacillus konkukensis]